MAPLRRKLEWQRLQVGQPAEICIWGSGLQEIRSDWHCPSRNVRARLTVRLQLHIMGHMRPKLKRLTVVVPRTLISGMATCLIVAYMCHAARSSGRCLDVNVNRNAVFKQDKYMTLVLAPSGQHLASSSFLATCWSRPEGHAAPFGTCSTSAAT